DCAQPLGTQAEAGEVRLEASGCTASFDLVEDAQMNRLYSRLAIALVGLLLLCSPGAQAEPAKKDGKPDLETVRATYAKKPCKALAIVEPVEVKNVYYWKDGGSIGLEVKDAKGTVHLFALDGREKGSRNLFVGVTYPSESKGKEIDTWGAEEQELYAVLL